MPTATRTFRVFVSSTFEDLKAERDALQRDVFLRLRKLCEANNERCEARFQAIDLRWGVRDEAALDQQTMEICRARLNAASRPASSRTSSFCSGTVTVGGHCQHGSRHRNSIGFAVALQTPPTGN